MNKKCPDFSGRTIIESVKIATHKNKKSATGRHEKKTPLNKRKHLYIYKKYYIRIVEL